MSHRYNHEVQAYHIIRQSKQIYMERCDSQFSRKLPLYNFPILWNRHLEDNMHDQMFHSILRRLEKSNFIDSYVEVVNCQNPVYRDCGSAQWFWVLLLTFSLNDDLIFHDVCLSFGGQFLVVARGVNAFCIHDIFIPIVFLGGCDENSKFCYLQSISS